jgi:predicted dithiol-disulfide oxidoreductase (DUF899 family)
MNEQMTGQPVVDAATWQTARDALLVEEKRLTRDLDRLAAQRRQMPWQRVVTDYRFTTPEGEKGLADLFEGRRQLVVYHHMLRENDPAPCPGCSMLADELPELAHLHARNTTLVMVSNAPLAQMLAFRQRMGWAVPWFETRDSFTPDHGYGRHGPGYSVFIRQGDAVFYTYGCTDRGTEIVGGTMSMLDITPMGRQEDWEQSPDWVPKSPPYQWWRLHDEYEPVRQMAGQ